MPNWLINNLVAFFSYEYILISWINISVVNDEWGVFNGTVNSIASGSEFAPLDEGIPTWYSGDKICLIESFYSFELKLVRSSFITMVNVVEVKVINNISSRV